MTLKGQKKRRMPRRMARKRAGRLSRDLPAGLCRTGLRRCRNVVEHQGNTRGLRREREAAAGGEVKHARLTPEFDHDSTKPRTTRAFKPGLQHGGGIARLNEDETLQRHAKSCKPRRIGRAGLPVEHRVADPEYGALPGADSRCGEGETGCRRAIGLTRGVKIEIGRSDVLWPQEGRQHGEIRGLRRRRCRGRDLWNAGKGERDRHIKCSYFVLLI